MAAASGSCSGASDADADFDWGDTESEESEEEEEEVENEEEEDGLLPEQPQPQLPAPPPPPPQEEKAQPVNDAGFQRAFAAMSQEAKDIFGPLFGMPGEQQAAEAQPACGVAGDTPTEERPAQRRRLSGPEPLRCSNCRCGQCLSDMVPGSNGRPVLRLQHSINSGPLVAFKCRTCGQLQPACTQVRCAAAPSPADHITT